MGNINKILIDTNVWLDVFLGYRPRHSDALELLKLAEERNVILLFPITSLKDVYYMVGARLKDMARKSSSGTLAQKDAAAAREAAWACIVNMQEIAAAVGADAADVWLASKYRPIHPDFEDNLIVAAGERSKADFLVTNDEKLLCHCPIPALSASDMCVLLRDVMS